MPVVVREDEIAALEEIIGMIQNGSGASEIREELLGEVDRLYCASFTDEKDAYDDEEEE